MLGDEQRLIEEYVETGKVKLIYWHVLDFGEPSLLAAEAAECAGEQGRFWEMNHALFENQAHLWRDTLETIYGLAGQIEGLDQGQFKSCMVERRYLAKVKADDEARRARGIRFRPSFDLDGERIEGALPYEQMRSRIEVALAD
ncbi:MAG: hypothetical protein Kow0047_30960 [Anaerolineae bacterium]